MGVWGTGPFDNDDSADMIAGLARKVHRVLERNDSDDYGEARAAAAFVLLAHGTDVLGGPGLGVVLKALVKMRENNEWLARYRQPQQIAAALNKEIGAVIARMRACKSCRRGHSEAEWKELETLARKARRAPVPATTWRTGRRKRRVSKARRRRIPRIKERRS